ncbi:MAG: hypothetical protein RLZZ46_758, partial [Bacteroidota bacterium]
YMIRQGNYFLNGFPLFVWLYYYIYIKSRGNPELEEDKTNNQINKELTIVRN